MRQSAATARRIESMARHDVSQGDDRLESCGGAAVSAPQRRSGPNPFGDGGAAGAAADSSVLAVWANVALA
jgi:hypothetical protein